MLRGKLNGGSDTINVIIIDVAPYRVFLINNIVYKYDTISSIILDMWDYWDALGVFEKQIGCFIQNKLWNIK